MTFELLLATVIPLILYVVVEVKKGPQAATITAMASVVVLAGYLYFRFDALDETYIVELLLILVLGSVSLKMHQSTWIKFQPMVTGIVFSAYGFYLQIFDTPMLLRMAPLIEKMAQSEQMAMFKTPAAKVLLSSMSWEISVLILLHALTCGYAAKKFNSVNWLLTRLAIYPAFIVYLLIRWVPFIVGSLKFQA